MRFFALWIVGPAVMLPAGWLGYRLMLDGVPLVVVGMIWFLKPVLYFQPVFLAELAAMLCLLIVGAKERPLIAVATT
ncbi:MAG TPA: hypothetical protein VGI45_20895 [Terracidiphilus sp.]